MPEFWEYPTVSMGLGPAQRHLPGPLQPLPPHTGGSPTPRRSRVWGFVGDGEFDEPETLGALALAGREQLDNLIFVVNCNLQRLDGPVRGNGKIIQELEARVPRRRVERDQGHLGLASGTSCWPRDVDGVLLNKMNTTVDGEFQKYATESRRLHPGALLRPRPAAAHAGRAPLRRRPRNLPRGGHDYRKLYAAYKAATEHEGAPTAILAKTVKGWTLGPEIEARNATHQIKKMTKAQLLALRDRLFLHDEIPDAALDADLPPYYRPPEGSPADEYLTKRRRSLGGSLPAPGRRARPLPRRRRQGRSPNSLAGSGGQAVSTTMAFARLLRNLLGILPSAAASSRSSPTRPAPSASTRCSAR